MTKKKILFTGGGTGGSVTPLLSISDKLRTKDLYDFFWIGTPDGIEKQMVLNEGIEYHAICNGRLRRYFSLRNFIDPFRIIAGFFQSIMILYRIKPDLVASAGGFVSVPVAWAAKLLRIPVLIHQQDVRPGLANQLMAPCAETVTVVFEKSLADYGKKAICVGNTIRDELRRPIRREWAIEKLGMRSDLPIVVAVGGGTGAQAINDMLLESLKDLTKICQIIHITGVGKNVLDETRQINNYKPFEFVNIEGLLKIYAVADIVISRCGMNTLTELSFLQKPSILIPMPDSHQEDNAQVFKERNAAIVLHQKDLNSKILAEEIIGLIKNKEKSEYLKKNIRGVIKIDQDDRLIRIMESIINKK